MKFEIDIEAALARALSPEVLNPMLDKHIQSAINSAIERSVAYSSEFQEKLKVQLKDAMPHALHIDDVAKFQHVLNASLNKAVILANEKTVERAVASVMKDLMPPLPEKIKLSELLKDARRAFHVENRAFYAHLEKSTWSSGGGWLYLDENEKPGTSRYSSSFETASARKYDAKFRIAYNGDGSVYSVVFEGQGITPKSKPNVVGRFDSILLAFYTGRCMLDLDIDADDVEALAAEQDEHSEDDD